MCTPTAGERLELPGVVHHDDEVLIIVNGRTHATVVVDELLLGYLQAHTITHLDNWSRDLTVA